MDNDLKYAVKCQLGLAEDNLCRAKSAARRADVNAEWGESGLTLRQIIDGYQAEVDRWKSTLDQL